MCARKRVGMLTREQAYRCLPLSFLEIGSLIELEEPFFFSYRLTGQTLLGPACLHLPMPG